MYEIHSYLGSCARTRKRSAKPGPKPKSWLKGGGFGGPGMTLTHHGRHHSPARSIRDSRPMRTAF